jgi:protein arginine kinase activator
LGVSDKRCELCGKHPGSVHFTEIEDAQIVKRFICSQCAQARGLLDEPAKPIVALQELLAMPALPAAAEPEAPAETRDVTCGGCGLTFALFRKQGRLGCASCYRAFEPQLVPLLRKIHAHVRHAGKSPRAYARKVELRQKVEDLRAELDRAVRGEDYERAADLRDQLRAVEQEQSLAARRAAGDGPARQRSASEES